MQEQTVPPLQKLGGFVAGTAALGLLVGLFGGAYVAPGRLLGVSVVVLLVGLSIAFSQRHPTYQHLGTQARRGLWLVGIGFASAALAMVGAGWAFPTLFFWLSTGLIIVGGILYHRAVYRVRPAGIQNDGVMQSGVTARGVMGWMLGIVMTGFYVLLYWFPQSLEGLVRTLDPMSWVLRGKAADQWFMYGAFYTIAVLVMGVRFLYKYRHSRYQQIRTFSVMFFQLGFAFLLPNLLVLFNEPEFYFSYFWPLKYEYLWPGDFGWGWILAHPGKFGVLMVVWGAVMSFVATPILTYFYGKRWYCSWVCGCGGLAETLGDPWRQLSDKSLKAWQIERWMIHSVLVFVVLATGVLWLNSAWEGGLLADWSGAYAKTYGFLIGSVFAGVIGVGFYPVLGSRMWCRFGCPMAAILGLQQKFFSRFRITTNGGQCISCGNCSAYCEMGIDVRWYAQRGQDVVRASCVGCGICSAVCPRGVLNLENGPRSTKTSSALLSPDLRILSDADLA